MADGRRRAFLSGLAPLRAGVALPLDVFAREMGRLWNTALPADFPAGYRPNPPADTPPPDLCAAVVVLLRVGLLAVDGIKVDAVTRTGFQPSQPGYLFIRNEEGLAPHLYWPGNENSGVTAGPGYDMSGRTTQEITSVLNAVGVPTAAAASVATDAAGLRGELAGAFVKTHRQVFTLTLLQQQSIFDAVVPTYVNVVRAKAPTSLRSRMFQHKFDALLSLAWNLRRYGHYELNSDVQKLDMIKADLSIKTLTGGGPGIPGRRVREAILLTDATYHIKALTLRNVDFEYYDDVPPGATSRG